MMHQNNKGTEDASVTTKNDPRRILTNGHFSTLKNDPLSCRIFGSHRKNYGLRVIFLRVGCRKMIP